MITISSLSGMCPQMDIHIQWPVKNIHSRTTDDNQMMRIIQMAIKHQQNRQQYLHMVDHNTKTETNNFLS